MNRNDLTEQILHLKKERNALILVHNYQRPEVQAIADYLGDSLDLARRATQTDRSLIVFCGVHFMAESATLLSPEKIILLPVLDAGCPLADCATPEMVRAARLQHPEAVFIAYINTSAAVKAEVDVVCTSANALKIIGHYAKEGRTICYLPDKNLAAFAEQKLGIKIITWPGQCYVHDRLITAEKVKILKHSHPDAVVVAHPEAPPEVLQLAEIVTGTAGMLKAVEHSRTSEWIVVTETGLIDRLHREYPNRRFYGIENAICSQMKLTTLISIRDALEKTQHRITVPEPVASKARQALNRMMELTL
ncbi:quinolinate synthase NadA [bacterium]|nr:quinolinate synthase NadA [candidate division CSSED10-310 bacterium]